MEASSVDVLYPYANRGNRASPDDTVRELLGLATGVNVKGAAASLPSLVQYADFAVPDICLFYPPVTNEFTSENEACLVEPLTPKFIPGLQDHYTGVVRAVAGLDGAAFKVGAEIDAKLGHGHATPGPAEEACDDDVRISKAIPIPGWLNGSAENNDSTKLQRLIHLQLHCAANAGDKQPKRSDDSGVGYRMPSNEATTPTDATTDAEDVHTDTSEGLGFGSPCGVRGDSFSHGSVGHPNTCAAPCKYFGKRRGCMDGLACSHCHLCVWRPQRRHRPKATRKSELR